ncbi:MAG TPA: ABC transporter permease [Bryobacteraceae bacterium]|nr:ABC transporter permease [Bryobacteraceae bacterium]
MGTFVQDVRFGFRTLVRSPGFTLVVILTLAIGIGANTAIFSIVDAVLLRPLPFHHADQLVRLVDDSRGLGLKDVGMSVPELRDLQSRGDIFSDVSAAWPIDANVTGRDHPERIELMVVSPNYFLMLGAKAKIGRIFGPQDAQQSFAEAAIISDALWHRMFGGDPKALGSRIRIDNDAYTIVGVMPPDFRHPGRTVATSVDVFGTAGFIGNPFPDPPVRAQRPIPGAMARLKSGVSLKEAQARLNAFVSELKTRYPSDYPDKAQWSLRLEPLGDSLVGGARPVLWALLSAVALMLLTGCVNIANLLLARASGREREIAIRVALGADRARIVRQLLTESFLLSLAAGVVGIIASGLSLNLLLKLAPTNIPRLNEVAVDGRVLLFTLCVSLTAGILFGLAPALESSNISLRSRGSSGSLRQSRVSSTLVVAEFAICLVLMTGAGLLVRSFDNLLNVDPGFKAQNILAARVWLPVPNNPQTDIYAKAEARAKLVREVLLRAESLPGIDAAAMATTVPFDKITPPVTITLEDHPLDATHGEFIGVSRDYFRVLGTPLVSGRFLDESDRPDTRPVALVDRSTAEKYWPNQSPIGKRLRLGPPQLRQPRPWLTIVGVVADIRQDAMNTIGSPHLYVPIYQLNFRTLALLLKSPSDPESLGDAARRSFQGVDPNLPVFGVRTFKEVISSSLGQQRFAAQLMTVFAGIAMLLASIGIYGVLAYSVGQRTRELGVRMALGAHGAELIRMVLWQGMRLILIGIVVGAGFALGLGRLLSGLLYGITAHDPLVFGTVAFLLAIIALLACYIPAWRATRVSPLVALRAD